MKKSTTFEVGGKQYTFLFTNRSLAMMERSIGRSILSIMSSGQLEIMQAMTISTIAAGIKHGLQELGDKDAYDVIDEICDAGGSIDVIAANLISALLATGLFTRGTAPEIKADKVAKP